MKKAIHVSIFAAFLLWGSAQADVVEFFVDGENDCSGVYGQGFENCAIGPIGGERLSSIIVKFDVDEDEIVINPLYPEFDLDDFDFDTVGDFGEGSWAYNPDAVVGIKFWVANAGNGFNVFYRLSDDDEANCGDFDAFECMSLAELSYQGDWMTPLNNQGRPRGLSHLSFYDSEVRIPEPGTLTLLGLGLLGMGLSRRRIAK